MGTGSGARREGPGGTPPRLGLLVGLDGVAEWMALRVARAELLRRLPDAHVVVLGPRPAAGPMDGGHPVCAAGEWTAQRRAELSAHLDVVGVIATDPADPADPTDPAGPAGPADPPGPDYPDYPADPADSADPADPPGPDYPAAGASRGWPPVDGLGAEHEASCPSVSLDTGALCLLAPQVLAEDALDRRLGWLRLMGWHPASGRTVLVNSAGLGAARVSAALGAAFAATSRHDDVAVVLLSDRAIGPGREGGAVLLPRSLSLEDVAALHRAAGVVLGAPRAAQDLAAAYGRPFVSCAGEADLSVDGVADQLEEALAGRGAGTGTSQMQLRRRWATVTLDAMASTAARARPAPATRCAGRGGWEEVAHGARERQLVGHRRLLAEHDTYIEEAAAGEQLRRAEIATMAGELAEVQARLAELRQRSSEGYARWEADLAAHREHVAALDRERAEIERQLVATRATRLFRYAAGPRRIYGAILRWRA